MRNKINHNARKAAAPSENDITVSQKAQPLYISVTDGYP